VCSSDLKKQLQTANSIDNFLGVSEPIVKMKKLVKRVASSESTVLIRGESGVGKDLIAKAIHHLSPRCGGPFVTINCAALPETLLETELFGHKKGSFTGAIRDKEGLFKVASGGTFFLDEVGNTSLSIQVKLLRVLEEKRITPVGDTKPIDVDVRLIAATNADLEADVRAGRFRNDLFYRLNVIPVYIPALRERAEDIPLLVEAFVRRFCEKTAGVKRIANEAMRLLAFDGRAIVRELEKSSSAPCCSIAPRIEPMDLPDPSPRRGEQIVREEHPETRPGVDRKRLYPFWMSRQTAKRRKPQNIRIDSSTLYRMIQRYNLQVDGQKRQTGQNLDSIENAIFAQAFGAKLAA
jgi:transcriptional regulator with GAF, ATPase, and Fis domain